MKGIISLQAILKDEVFYFHKYYCPIKDRYAFRIKNQDLIVTI